MQNNRTGIHIVLGTKAQLIKMLPIFRELEKRNLPYNFIDTGQHPLITEELRKIFGLREPDIYLAGQDENITGIIQALIWNVKIILKSLFQSKKILRNSKGVCLVHGDTISTLQGLIMAKVAGLKVGHVEAGERTHNLFKPFPEEVIRIIVDRFTDYAFASSQVSEKNLLKEKIKGQIINVGCNTIMDAVQIAASQESIKIDVPPAYVLVSIHRFETIQSKHRMKIIVETVEKISEKLEIVWGLHEPTRNQLVKFNLLQVIENKPRIHLRKIWDYFSFIKAIKLSEFLLTDGGGPQEESCFLNVPCMLMRSETEREYNPNVYLTKFEPDRIDFFVENYKQFRKGDKEERFSPSKSIVNFLERKLQGE
jgi:UDP-N-acetylglucosamine 2-epimerase (non-hydrolysing)